MKTVFAQTPHCPDRPVFRSAMGLFTPLFLVVLALFTALPSQASAQALSLGGVMCNAVVNIKPFIWLFTGVAYIAGGYFIGHGLYLLARHHENPRETQFHNPLMHLVGGTCLLAFPSFINFMLETLGLIGPGGGGMPVCTGVINIGTALTGDVGLDVLLENLIYNIRDPLTVLASIVAIVLGVLMIFRGLVKASKYGYDPRGTKVSHVLANLIIGSILVVVGQSLGTMLTTLFGSSFINSSYDVLSWNFFNLLPADNGTLRFQYAVMAALTFVQLVGLIAFVRGWLIMKNAIEGAGQANMAQGLTHVIGGAFAINIFYVLEMFDATFGTGFLNV